jgi:hypothetical protein
MKHRILPLPPPSKMQEATDICGQITYKANHLRNAWYLAYVAWCGFVFSVCHHWGKEILSYFVWRISEELRIPGQMVGEGVVES